MIREYKKLKNNPFFLFVTLLLTVLVAEIIVMFILPIIVPNDTPELLKNVVDGLLLSMMIAPVIWKLVVVPLRGDLYQAQKRAHLIIDTAQRGILSLDGDGFIKSANPSAQEIFDKQEKNILGENYRNLIPSLSQLDLNKIDEKAINFKSLNGNEKHLYLTSVKTFFEEEVSYIFFVEDNTEKIKIEKDLEIQKANAAASARLAILGEMAGGVAHEINTPLAALKLLIGQTKRELSEGSETTRIVEILKRMDKTTDRITGIVSGMRSLTRDGSKDHMEVVSLRQIIEDVISLAWEKFYNHGVDLKIEEINDQIKINCRSVEIGQVLLNFLCNSYDAIEGLSERWVTLKVLSRIDKNEIIITDSGKGIPESIAKKIFDPFFTTKEVGKGTGLGLSISSGIIQAHGGSVRLNRESPNTQFIITFPAVQ